MKRLVAAVLLALTAPLANAWGPEGHRIVAQIAVDHLTPKARAAIDALLAGEPDPTLPGIANWADENREKNPGTGPLHYINMPKGDCRYVPLRDCPGGACVVGGIEHSIAMLKFAAATREQRLIALKYLVHFVGDVHQPLHAGLAEDRGGNSYKIDWAGKEENLHRLWDSDLITRTDPDWQHYAQRLDEHAGSIGLVSLDAADWAMASCAIAQGLAFYPEDHQPGNAYFVTWQPVVDQQLSLGGLRLAAWLNILF